MTFRISRLTSQEANAIAGPSGPKLKQRLDKAFDKIEEHVADLETQLAAIQAAQTTATASYRELARLNSYPNPAGVLAATDAGTNATITVTGHTRVYPVQGSIDVPDVTVAGGTITGLAYSTDYFVYYDDTTLTNAAPTYQATITAATAQVGAAAGRHYVGAIATPAHGGGGTTGTPPRPPGGGDIP